MPYRIEFNGQVVHADTAMEVRELLAPVAFDSPAGKAAIAHARTLKDVVAAAQSLPPLRKKPGPKPRAKEAGDDVLTADQKAKLAAEVPLICRKPHGCGQPFESKNRMAWYCPSCTAKRDEGRPV